MLLFQLTLYKTWLNHYAKTVYIIIIPLIMIDTQKLTDIEILLPKI